MRDKSLRLLKTLVRLQKKQRQEFTQTLKGGENFHNVIEWSTEALWKLSWSCDFIDVVLDNLVFKAYRSEINTMDDSTAIDAIEEKVLVDTHRDVLRNYYGMICSRIDAWHLKKSTCAITNLASYWELECLKELREYFGIAKLIPNATHAFEEWAKLENFVTDEVSAEDAYKQSYADFMAGWHAGSNDGLTKG